MFLGRRTGLGNAWSCIQLTFTPLPTNPWAKGGRSQWPAIIGLTVALLLL